MNTGIRRFILRLIVGLLTFVIGVAAAMLIGGFRPGQGYFLSPNYSSGRHHRCRDWAPPPPPSVMLESDMDRVYPSCLAKRMERMSELPPLPREPQSDATVVIR